MTDCACHALYAQVDAAVEAANRSFVHWKATAMPERRKVKGPIYTFIEFGIAR